jgi:hypothetical protein
VARGAVRGALTAWLGLIVLHGLTTKGGSKAVGGAFDVVGNVVERALSPDVPAIPDRRTGESRHIEQDTPTTPAAPTKPVPNRVPIPGNGKPTPQ